LWLQQQRRRSKGGLTFVRDGEAVPPPGTNNPCKPNLHLSLVFTDNNAFLLFNWNYGIIGLQVLYGYVHA